MSHICCCGEHDDTCTCTIGSDCCCEEPTEEIENELP